MAKLDDLAAKVEELSRVLQQHGIEPRRDVVPPEELADYVPHGSAAHAAFLGLVEVQDDDKIFHMVEHASPRTGRVFRLEDEMGATQHYPHIDPEKAILLVLQQKVNELEVAPEVPDDAQPMFRPLEAYG